MILVHVTKKTHGNEVLVKGRTGEEIFLICVKHKSVYQWKPIDGEFVVMLFYFLPEQFQQKIYLTLFNFFSA